MTKRILSFCLSVILLVSMMSVCGLVLPVMAATDTAYYVADSIVFSHEDEIIMADVPYNFTYTATGLVAGTTYRARAYSRSLGSWITPSAGSTAVADANGTVTINIQDLTLAAADDWAIVCDPLVNGAWGDTLRVEGGGWLDISLKARPGVYVDSKVGSDDNDGLSSGTAKKTIKAALEIVNGADYTGARVINHVASDWGDKQLSPDLATGVEAWTQPITLRSTNKGTTMWFNAAYFKARGPIRFEHTKIGRPYNDTLRFMSGLYELTFANDVTFDTDTFDYMHGYSADSSAGSTGTDGQTAIVDLSTQDLDFVLSELNLPDGFTLNCLSFGVAGSNTGAVKMGSANIVLDDPNVAITKPRFASLTSYGSTGGFAYYRNNHFTGNFNVTINDVASLGALEFSGYQPGYYIEGAAQFLFNNGWGYTAAGEKVTVAAFNTNTAFDRSSAVGGQYILRSEKKDGCYLEVTDTKGVYTVYGGKVATAVSADGSKTYISGNGVLTIPTAGDYTVTYGDPTGIYVDCTNGSDTANDGFSPATALKSFAAAVKKINALGLKGDNRQVLVKACGWGEASMDFSSCDPWTENITITNAPGFNGTAWLGNQNIVMNGPLTLSLKVGYTANDINVYTHGYDLTLGEYYYGDGDTTNICMGYDHTRQNGAFTVDANQYIQFNKDMSLTIKESVAPTDGSARAYSVRIYCGNSTAVSQPVQYGDVKVNIDNPNLTVALLDLGNADHNANWGSIGNIQNTRFESLKVKVDRVAAITTISSNSHQHSLYADTAEFLFNNGTWDKITGNNVLATAGFNAAYDANGVKCPNAYLLKSDATEGSSLDFTSTPGTYAVTSGLTANATDGTDTIYAQGGKLTVSKGVYDVTYSNKISDLDGSTVTVPAGGQTIAVSTPPAKLPIAVAGDGQMVVIAGRHLVDPQAPVKDYTATDYTDYITYRKPLTNTYNKITNNKKLTVSFMGGSVTIGTGGSSGWAQRSEPWFRSTFPNATFTFRNVGSGESGTYLATYRVVQDVISQNPDLFVIEYAINDTYKLSDGYNKDTGVVDKEKAAAAQKQAAAQYETIIREVKAALPNCDIVTVLTTDRDVHARAEAGLYDTELYPTAQGHADMAEKYNISVVNVGESLADYIDESGEAWGTYFIDSVHPNDTGYQEYYKCFVEYLTNELVNTDYTGVTGGRDVLIPVQSDALLDGNRVFAMAGESVFYPANQSAQNIAPDAFDGYMTAQTGFSFEGTKAFKTCYATTYFGYYYTEAEDSSITFTFDGTEFSFWNNYYGLSNYNSLGYGYEVVRVSDSTTVAEGTNTFEKHAPSQVVSGLDSDKYTVTITPQLSTDGNGAVIPFQIGAILFRDATKASVKGDVDYYADGVDCMSLTLPEGNWTIQFLDADATVADLPLPTVGEGETLLGWYNENSEKLEDAAALPAGSVLTAVIAEDGHEHNYEWTYDDAQHWKECSCGLLEGEKANHNFSDWETTRDPSTTETGEKQRSCECGKVETQSIPMLEVPAEAIYVDGTNGDDENSGASAEKAVKTVAAAIAKIEEQGLTGDKRTIIVVNAEATYSLDLHSVATYTEMITLVTADPDATIKMSTGTVALAGPMTINAKIGNETNKNASYIYSRGFELVLGELFEDVYYDTYWNGSANVTGGGSTTIAIGYMPNYDPLDPGENKVIQFGKDISLTVLGNKSYAVSIFVGNSNTVGNPVQYGDAYVYLNNPNLTVKTFDFGNRGSYNNTSSDWSKHTRFDDLKVVIDQVAVIEKWQVNSYNHAVATNTLQVLFNNNTYAKTTFDSNFSWQAGYPNAAFNSNKHYIMKSAATDGSKLQLTETVGTFNVVSSKPVGVVTDGTNTYKSGNGKVAVGAVGIFDVTYSDPTGIYVDCTNGSDSGNDGFSPASALKSFAAAVNKINSLGLTGDARQIIVVKCGWAEGNLNLSSCTPWTENITISCENPGTTIWLSNSSIMLNGPMTLNAIVGDSAGQSHVYIYTRGYDLVLGDRYINSKYTDKGAETVIYAGVDYAAQAAGLELSDGRYQLGRDNNVTIKGTKTQTATIYFGNKAEFQGTYYPVKYNDGNLVIDNPNLTISLLQFGITTNQASNNTANGGRWEALSRYDNLKIQIDNVAAISNVKVGSYQGGVGASSVQAIFNNDTYEKVTFASFNWSTGDWTKNGFVTSKAYVVKSGTDGYLEFTETPGTFAVTADKPVAVATPAGGSATYVGSATLTVPSANGVYTVTYSTPTGIYVDFANGDDGNDGYTATTPLKTIVAAINKVNAEGLTGDNRKVVVVGDGQGNLDMRGVTPYAENITLYHLATNGTFGAGTIWLNDSVVRLGGPLTINAVVGKAYNQALTIHTYGHELVLAEKFQDSYYNTNAANDKPGTQIYLGYDHAFSAIEPVDGVINYGKGASLTIKGTNQNNVRVYVGNNFGGWNSDAYVVQYGDVNLTFDNPNLTVNELRFGNANSYAVGAGSSGRQNVFANVNFTVKNVNAINLVASHTHNNASEVTGKLVAVFSNDTFSKTTFADNFKWHAGGNEAGFRCGTYNVLKSAVTSGAYLTAGDVPGFVNVVSDLPATAESDSIKLTSEDGVLSNLPNGVYDVKYYQVVYVDAENGDDENDGLTASSAVKTIGKAMAIINGDYVGERVVYMVKTTTDMSGNFTTAGKYDEPITVRGKTASDTIWVSDANVILAGPVIFEQTRIGFVNAETTLNFHANGHVLKVTETVIIPNPVSIVAGVHGGYKEFGGNVMHVEFAGQLMKRAENDIVPTITEIVMAGEANRENPQRFTYAYAYLNIDNANAAIGRIRLGYEHVANNASPVPSDGNYSLPNSEVTGDFTVYLNAASLGGIAFPSHHNGALIFGDLQIVLNNGIGNGLTVANHRDIIGFTVIGKQLVLRSEAADGCRLETSTKVGTYRVIGNRVAVATDGETVYRSKNGDLAVTEGDYVVTYEPIGEYFFVGDVLTAVTDLNNVDISDVALTQDGNRILLGWTLADGTPVADVTNVTISAGETLKAVYGDFNVSYESGNADFFIEGVQMRATNSQGLRFVFTKGTNFDAKFEAVSGVKYGYVLLPKQKLVGELTVNTAGAVTKDNSNGGFVYFDESGDRYTVCLTNIAKAYYNTVYVARGYTTYTDINGVERTVYTEQYACSLFEAAALTLSEADAGHITLDAGQRGKVVKVLADYRSHAKQNAIDKINNVADTLIDNTSGKIYYVSPNGDDTNDGWHSPWKTIGRLNQALENGEIKTGDAVLFERGGEYRLNSVSYGIKAYLVNGVSYGAYGTGAKPVINGSVKNYVGEWLNSGENEWTLTLTDIANIYVDPGVIVFDGGRAVGARQKNFADVAKNYDFSWKYNNNGTGTITLRYDGDLNADFTSIEIGTDLRLLDICTDQWAESNGLDSYTKADYISNMVIENLEFRNSGGFGVRASDNANITVRGCTFYYIGGSYDVDSDLTDYEAEENLDAEYTRYGNAVEFMQNSENILVDRCYMEEIYDTAATFQGGKSSAMTVKDFTMSNCVTVNCGLAGFEYWFGTGSVATGVTIKNNYMEGSGCGWGGEQRPTRDHAAHIRSTRATEEVYDFVIAGNFFDGTNFTHEVDGSHAFIFASNLSLSPELQRNVYIDSSSASLGRLEFGYGNDLEFEQHLYDEDARQTLKNVFGDTAPIVIFTESLA